MQFVRLDGLAANDPPRYPIVDLRRPEDSNHAWITYSGFNAKTPTTPGHVFEIRYVPAPAATRRRSSSPTSTATTEQRRTRDIPAHGRSSCRTSGTIYVGNDFGVVRSKNGTRPSWHETAAGLPNVTVADLVLVPERGVLYAGTHGQGVWQLKVH